MISLLANLGLGAIIGGGVVYLFIKSFIPKYLSEKTSNLAEKHDVMDIYDKIDSVKLDHEKILDEVRSNYNAEPEGVSGENDIAKKVYLEAVEAIVKSHNMIFNFCNLNMLEQDITSCLNSDAGKIEKVTVLGSPNTVKAISSFMASISAETLRLTLERRELMSRKSNIQRVEHLRICSKQEIDRYIALMQNLNLEGNSDPRLWETINSGVKYEQEKVSKYNIELEQLWLLQNSEHMKLTKRCMNTSFRVSKLLPIAVLSIREDVGLGEDIDNYITIFNENIKKGRQLIGEFLKQIEHKNT